VIVRAGGLEDVYLIEPEPIHDERGFFARSWCQRELARHGLVTRLVQCSISYTRRKGTLRGLHYQAPPHQEVKVVRCTRGAIYDVVLDLRRESATFGGWVAVVLSADDRQALYIGTGLAHGFQTLQDDCEVYYQMSEFYAPESARGVRWNDPAFGISWPDGHPIVSPRDDSYPDFRVRGALRR
jgi:dTDP-4-dehydrorhamnose 3,5-epimerase